MFYEHLESFDVTNTKQYWKSGDGKTAFYCSVACLRVVLIKSLVLLNHTVNYPVSGGNDWVKSALFHRLLKQKQNKKNLA